MHPPMLRFRQFLTLHDVHQLSSSTYIPGVVQLSNRSNNFLRILIAAEIGIGVIAEVRAACFGIRKLNLGD